MKSADNTQAWRNNKINYSHNSLYQNSQLFKCSIPVMDPKLTSSLTDPAHADQNCKYIKGWTAMARLKLHNENVKYSTHCLKASLTRLFNDRGGLKLLYHGIFVTPGQINSSGVPHSSKILFSCSGCSNRITSEGSYSYNLCKHKHELPKDTRLVN